MKIPKPPLVISRFIIGGILLISGLAKVSIAEDFALSVSHYGLGPDVLAYAYGYALPFIEIILGILFFIGKRLKLVSIVAMPVVTTFVVANIVDLMRAGDKCLTCFGDWVHLLPGIALGIDILMLGLALLLFFKADSAPR